MVKRALGNWVVGDRFWDRERELALFLEYLRAGANILLAAPRRIGKTSLMREAARHLDGEFICLQVDLQKANSPGDAIVELTVATKPHLGLWNKTKTIFGGIVEKLSEKLETLKLHELTVTLRGDLTDADWREKGDRLFEILSQSELPVIIFLDEVPILVNRILQGSDYRITTERRQETDAFMSWLRENTIRHQGKVRVVVTGSIGFEPILHIAGLNATLNTFTSFSLGAWTPDVAKAFLREIAHEYGLDLDEECATLMVEKLGYCIPHYVQVYFDNVYRTCKMQNVTTVSKVLVYEVYQNQMLSIRGHAEMSHLEERLKTVLGPQLYPLALELLTEATVSGNLTHDAALIISDTYTFEDRSNSDVLREVLGILEHDLYITLDGQDGYRPVCRFVADWWKARFGFGYKPAMTRKRHS